MDIALMADKGGVGKTTLAYHLCGRLAQLGYDVGLVDLDQQLAALRWHNAADRPDFPVYGLNGERAKFPQHEVLVWDTPAHPSKKLQDQIAKLVDLILLVAQTDADSQHQAVTLARRLRGGPLTRVLLNGVRPNSNQVAVFREGFESLGIPCLESSVRKYVCYEYARWDNRLISDYPYPSADTAYQDIKDLTAEVLALVEVSHVAATA